MFNIYALKASATYSRNYFYKTIARKWHGCSVALSTSLHGMGDFNYTHDCGVPTCIDEISAMTKIATLIELWISNNN